MRLSFDGNFKNQSAFFVVMDNTYTLWTTLCIVQVCRKMTTWCIGLYLHFKFILFFCVFYC